MNSDYDSEDDSDESVSKIKNDALKDIQDEISDQSDEDKSGSGSSDSDGDGQMTMNFDELAKKKKKAKKDNATGIMNMKFMKTAEHNKKERIKEQTKMLIEQIEEDEQLQN